VRDYAAACTPPIARYDDRFLRRIVVERPRAIVRCMDPSDVSATIAHARRHHLDIAIRSGGPLVHWMLLDRRHRHRRLPDVLALHPC